MKTRDIVVVFLRLQQTEHLDGSSKQVFHAQINITDLKESEEKGMSLAVGSRFAEILENEEEFLLKAWNGAGL